MCGIFGLITEDLNIERARLSLDTLLHRGPDQWGEYNENRVYLGHRRLSIIDLSKNGRQPMISEDGDVIITVNGEIYNYREIRNELKQNYNFRSESDSEVILHGYRHFGIDGLLGRIDGMFAICIYDKKLGKVFLARDRAGIKPLFYGIIKGAYTWASELKAIEKYFHQDLEKDNSAIYDYLTYLYIPQTKTYYHNIYKLKPAHYLEIDVLQHTSDLRKYWSLKCDSANNLSLQEAGEHLRFLIRKSVKEQMMSDVPLGYFLSGGIDSSIVVYEASKVNETNKTYTIEFEDPIHSEAIYAATVAGLSGTQHKSLKLSEEDAVQLLPEMIRWYDEPFADTSAIPSYLVSKFARKDVTVALTGDGGDELFGGYLWYSNFIKYSKKYWHIPVNQFLLNIRNRYRYKIPGKISNRLLNYNLPEKELYVKLMGGMLREEKNRYRAILGIEKDYDDYWCFNRLASKENISIKDLMILDFETYLPDDILTKMDRVSMAVSLEVRVPLLSRELIEFVFSLPEEILIYQGNLKGLVKYAYTGLLPSEILHRKKRGFNIPVHKWEQIYDNTYLNMSEILLNKIYDFKLPEKTYRS
jgi:asparagine synthase (glutamine-hydrolysing)